MPANMVLEKELRVVHVDLQAEGETIYHIGHSFSIEYSKAYLQGDTLPTTQLQLLQQGHT